jgi:hypothetical protein
MSEKPRFPINVQPDGWVLPNRAKYVNWIDKEFKYGTASSKQKCTTCEEGEACPIDKNTKPADEVSLFPHQKFVKDYIQFASPYRGILLYHGLGSGKCFALNTLILIYPLGTRKVQDIKIGDLIMGDDFTPRTVLTLATGVDNMYNIIYPDGNKYTVNSEHILCLKKTYDINIIDDYYEISVKNLLKPQKHPQSQLFGYKVNPNIKIYPITIEYAGRDNYYGFSVDDNHKFLLGDFTVTHNSCSSIAAAEILMNHMDVIVMQPASLRGNYINEIRKCGRKYYQLKQHWVKQLNPSEQELMKVNITPALVKKHKGLWSAIPNKPSNFTQLKQNEVDEIMSQTNNIIENRYHFINFDGLRKDSIMKMFEHGNPFDNKCVVIDEVHNLISRIKNQGITGRPIYNGLMQAKNCKLILLSGTPVINYPSEISYIINLLTGYRTLYTADLTKGSADDLETEIQSLKYIDYYQIDKLRKKIIFSVLPDQFIWKNKNRHLLEVKRETTNQSNPHTETISHIITALKSKNLLISTPTILSAVTKPKKDNDKLYKVLPEDDEEFNETFVDMENYVFKNSELFMRRILGTVSYYNSYSLELFPSVKIHEVPLTMPKYMFSEYQRWRIEERNKERMGGKPAANVFSTSGQVYRFYSRAICNFVFPAEIKRTFPSDLRKMKNEVDDADDNLGAAAEAQEAPENKDDGKDIDKKYKESLERAIRELRQSDRLDMDKIGLSSPKFYEIMTKLSDLDGTALIYSQFRMVEGLGLLSATMDRNGYTEFKIKKNENGEWILNMPDKDLNTSEPKYFQFRGNTEETQILMKIFNSDIENVPNLIREKLWHKDNLRGELIKVIMITQSGSEGISLKNVRQVHIMEPFWNHIRIDQVIGRAVRTCSHVGLPAEDRNVNVYIYYMIFTNEQIKDSFTIAVKDKSLTSDQYLYDISKKKKRIVDSMLDLLKKASVDCALNAKYHKSSDPTTKLKCFAFPVNVADDKFTFTFDINKDTYDNEYKQEIEQKDWKGRVLVTKYGKFLIRPVTNDVYDYEIYLETDRLVRLGKLIQTPDGKRMIKMKESPRLSPAPSIDMPEKPTYFSPDTDIPSNTTSSATSTDKSSKSTASKSTATSTDKSTSASQSESSSASSQSSPKDHPPLAMLKNQSNSCFIDSVLIALMHIKKDNNPILKDILESANSYTNVKNRLTLAKYGNSIKDELVSIYNKIHADSKDPIYICGSIRSLFDKFDKQYTKQINENLEEIEWLTSQQEPADFIRILDRIFNIHKNTVVQNTTTIEEAVPNSPQKVMFNDIIIEPQKATIDVSDFIPVTTNEFINNITHKKTITKRKYLESTGLFVNIMRGYKGTAAGNTKSTAKVITPETITLGNNKELNLVSIIVHHGRSIGSGHYTCLVKHATAKHATAKHDGAWYNFDDLKDNYEYIGKFENISENVFKNQVALIYI